jgi:tight adherence protein B
MARALRAGHSIGSAIEVISEQAQQPVAGEFGHVSREQSLGLPFRESLMNMSRRVASQDLQFLITAMLVQKETGGNLIEILDRTGYVIRERLRIHGEVRVKTAQGRLTGWILSALPVIMGTLINLLNPGFEGPLFHDPLGKMFLYCGCGMLVVGTLIVRKIVDIKV